MPLAGRSRLPLFDRLLGLVGRLRKRSAPWMIRVSEDGVALFREEDRLCHRFAWGEVREVVAFKRDPVTTDLVFLSFLVGDGWIEVDEEDEGWSALTDAMATRLPIDPPDRFAEVVHPPFATCERVVYRSRIEATAGPDRKSSGKPTDLSVPIEQPGTRSAPPDRPLP